MTKYVLYTVPLGSPEVADLPLRLRAPEIRLDGSYSTVTAAIDAISARFKKYSDEAVTCRTVSTDPYRVQLLGANFIYEIRKEATK